MSRSAVVPIMINAVDHACLSARQRRADSRERSHCLRPCVRMDQRDARAVVGRVIRKADIQITHCRCTWYRSYSRLRRDGLVHFWYVGCPVDLWHPGVVIFSSFNRPVILVTSLIVSTCASVSSIVMDVSATVFVFSTMLYLTSGSRHRITLARFRHTSAVFRRWPAQSRP